MGRTAVVVPVKLPANIRVFVLYVNTIKAKTLYWEKVKRKGFKEISR